MPSNPFKPTAGATPPLLLGRDAELISYAEAVENGSGAPDLLLLITGARGVGKTVMLTALGDVAREHQWVVIDETATPGFAERIAVEADRYREQIGNPARRRISGITLPSVLGVGGGGATFAPPGAGFPILAGQAARTSRGAGTAWYGSHHHDRRGSRGRAG